METGRDEPEAPPPTTAEEPFVYPDALSHLTDELVYVRALLSRYLESRGMLAAAEEALGGLAIGPAEIRSFLAGAQPSADGDQEAFISELRKTIDERVASTRASGVKLPIFDLAATFGLSPLEVQIVLVLLAPEVEPAFERAYAFAWNDFSRKTADLGFVLAMVGGGFRERMQHALVFSPSEGLSWHGLVEVESSAAATQRTWLARRVRLASRVVSFVLSDPTPDERIAGCSRLIDPRARRADIVLQEDELDVIWRTLAAEVRGARTRLGLRGVAGSGKKMILEAFLAEVGQRLLVVDLAPLMGDASTLAVALRSARREAMLMGAALYLNCAFLERDDELPQGIVNGVEGALRDLPGLLVFGANHRVPFFLAPRDGLVDIHIPLPEAAERAVLWSRAMSRRVKLAEDVDLERVARQYPLSGGGIQSAAREAVSRARRRSATDTLVHRADLAEAAREQLTGRLSHLATRITTHLGFGDLVLPGDAMGRLEELTAFARHRKKVFDQWGFGAILPYGRGLSALFHGPPGTGKTMVAGIIAGALGMDLFRVDLSRIVSKYVGETEKNLARIFDEAGQSHSVLLFDEADSLFAKRTQVKSATDRYANLEVNYLLQRMEDFEGVTILTTNFESGLDDAFKRRLRFRIEFPAPDVDAREALWRKMLPAAADVVDDIRFDDLAHDFDLTGGHIKNAVLRAAFVAAERDEAICHDDLRTAGAQECREIGQLVREWSDEDEEGAT